MSQLVQPNFQYLFQPVWFQSCCFKPLMLVLWKTILLQKRGVWLELKIHHAPRNQRHQFDHVVVKKRTSTEVKAKVGAWLSWVNSTSRWVFWKSRRNDSMGWRDFLKIDFSRSVSNFRKIGRIGSTSQPGSNLGSFFQPGIYLQKTRIPGSPFLKMINKNHWGLRRACILGG